MLIVTRDGIKTEDQLVNEDIQEGSTRVVAVPEGGTDVDAVCGNCGMTSTVHVVPGQRGQQICPCGWLWMW